MNEKENYIKVDIYSINQEIILSARNCTVDGNRIMLTGIDLPRLEHKTIIKAIGYLKDGIVVMEGIVTISTDLQINLEILDDMQKQERRQNIKVRTEFKSKIIKAYRNVESKRGLIINDEIQARDISVGGICFYSNRRFFKNQAIFFEFNQSKPPFVVEAQILRKETGHNKREYKYRYGCKLVNLSKVQQQSICEYVFKVEIENYRKSNR
ncbi:MAG: PilZ domain-containing protein [Eubacteriales bacterium]